jgi:hypothetical protein
VNVEQRRSESFSYHVRVASNPDWWEEEIMRRGQATNHLFPPQHVCTFSQITPHGGNPGDILLCCVECFNGDGTFVPTPGLLLNIGVVGMSTVYPPATSTSGLATRPASQQRPNSASEIYGSEEGSVGEHGAHIDQQALQGAPPSTFSRLDFRGLCQIISNVFVTFFHGIEPMADR